MPPQLPPETVTVLETCLYVDDLAAAEGFYRDVLGLQVVSRQGGRHVFFRCGSEMLLLFDPRASSELDANVPAHGPSGPGHVAFAISTEQGDAWSDHLSNHRVAVEQIVTWPNGIRSIYFRDPAGNSLELVSRRLWFES